MNEQALLEYASHELQTYVKRYDGQKRLLETCCTRMDFPDPVRDPEAWEKAVLDTVDPAVLGLVLADGFAVFCIVCTGQGCYLAGPLTFQEEIPLFRRLESGALDPDCRKSLPKIDFEHCVSLLVLLHNLYHSDQVDASTVIQKNCTEKAKEVRIQTAFSRLVFQNNEESLPHNPYEQEFREQMSIEQGNLEQLQASIEEDYQGIIGTLAKDPLRNLQNRAIVVITLACRSAIRGGVSPEASYSLSDTYIQQVEEAPSPFEAMQLARQAEYQYARMVREARANTPDETQEYENPVVNRCKNYIYSHLHDRVTVQSLADNFGFSPGYLSGVFKKYEGIPLAQYILCEKISRAKNLLTYSDYSFSEIATYLGFSSQSHLGAQFKKITGRTLRQYRMEFGRAEVQ